MKAYNKRLNHFTEIEALDFSTKKAMLVAPNSNPVFVYLEKIENIEILEYTGVILDGEKVYTKDTVTDGTNKYLVKKVPGGYYPFMLPINKSFKKVNE